MTVPIAPFWFKQRQCKLEAAGDNLLKATGPNLPEAFLFVRQEGGTWVGGLKLAADGPEVASGPADPPSIKEAWNVAFEMYRQHVIA